jgi:hypothetical protein
MESEYFLGDNPRRRTLLRWLSIASILLAVIAIIVYI